MSGVSRGLAEILKSLARLHSGRQKSERLTRPGKRKSKQKRLLEKRNNWSFVGAASTSRDGVPSGACDAGDGVARGVGVHAGGGDGGGHERRSQRPNRFTHPNVEHPLEGEFVTK